ncbi:hypothetical protein D3C75_662230 [compost metagenome]
MEPARAVAVLFAPPFTHARPDRRHTGSNQQIESENADGEHRKMRECVIESLWIKRLMRSTGNIAVQLSKTLG